MKRRPNAGLLVGMTLAAATSGAEVGPEAQPPGDVLVAGGTVIVQGEPPAAVDILLSRTDRGLFVEAMVDPGSVQAPDTIDVSGLYVHTASGLSARDPFQVGAHAMYVVRTGPSQGDAARMLISASEVRRLESSANYPEGPVHEAAGCYSVERGSWDPLPDERALERVPVPESVHLHWQYMLHLGREQSLAATDGDGAVPVHANHFGWAPAGGDSIRIDLGDGQRGVRFRLLRDGNGYTGTVAHLSHFVDGSPVPQAATRLEPTPCPP
jgi:hypothetical protein